MMRTLPLISAFLQLFILASCQQPNNQLYDKLERQLGRRVEVARGKEKELEQVKSHLKQSQDDDARLALYEDLVQEYQLFCADSATKYIEQAMTVAQRLRRDDYIHKMRLMDAYILATSGHYSDAEKRMKEVDIQHLGQADTVAYYETWRWIYNTWEAYVKDEHRAATYHEKGKCYLDTLCTIVPESTADGLYFRAERQWALGNLKEAEKLYLNCISMLDDSHRRYASATCALAMVYETQQRYDDFEHYMILSAIADQKIPLKENLAMQKLAEYQLKHKSNAPLAQRYLVYSVEDAICYNNRLRLTEIARKLPEIALAYQQEEDSVTSRQVGIILVISALAMALLAAVLAVLKQNKRLAMSKKDMANLYDKLKHTSRIREQYVGLFVELCAVIIDKYNNLTKTIERKVKAHQVDDLLSLLHSNRLKDKDVQEVLNTFDHAFLTVYPHFVEELNALLKPEYRIQPKKDQLLNAEQRIMAFLRIGVKDTGRIATLLLYSPQTIYNYRSTLKNHAIDKDHFEEQVAHLCENE